MSGIRDRQDALGHPSSVREVQRTLEPHDEESLKHLVLGMLIEVAPGAGTPVTPEHAQRHVIHAPYQRNDREQNRDQYAAQYSEEEDADDRCKGEQPAASSRPPTPPSRRRSSRVRRITVVSINPITATSTIAPSVASARFRKSDVRKSKCQNREAGCYGPGQL